MSAIFTQPKPDEIPSILTSLSYYEEDKEIAVGEMDPYLAAYLVRENYLKAAFVDVAMPELDVMNLQQKKNY